MILTFTIRGESKSVTNLMRRSKVRIAFIGHFTFTGRKTVLLYRQYIHAFGECKEKGAFRAEIESQLGHISSFQSLILSLLPAQPAPGKRWEFGIFIDRGYGKIKNSPRHREFTKC